MTPGGAAARGESWWSVALASVVTVVLHVAFPAKYRVNRRGWLRLSCSGCWPPGPPCGRVSLACCGGFNWVAGEFLAGLDVRVLGEALLVLEDGRQHDAHLPAHVLR